MPLIVLIAFLTLPGLAALSLDFDLFVMVILLFIVVAGLSAVTPADIQGRTALRDATRPWPGIAGNAGAYRVTIRPGQLRLPPADAPCDPARRQQGIG